MEQFIRKVTLTTNGVTINPAGNTGPQLKIAFNISKTIDGEQNEGTITLYNLSESTRNAMGREYTDVTLEAGYTPPSGGSNVGVIFLGQIRDVVHTRDGADILTELSVAEGEKAVRKSTVSKTLPKGSTVEDVANEIMKGFETYNITKGDWKFPDDLPTFTRPYSMFGNAAREFDRLGDSFGFYWSIQGDVLDICPGDGYLDGSAVLNAKTGLIDVPALTDNGCKFKALLNPDVRPGREVVVESSIIEMNSAGGRYRVSECTFSGDNRDGEFSVSGTGEIIDGDTVDEGETV